MRKDKSIMELAGKKVLVVGCGKSGIGSAVFLLQEGADPILFDESEKLTAEKVRESLQKNRGTGTWQRHKGRRGGKSGFLRGPCGGGSGTGL